MSALPARGAPPDFHHGAAEPAAPHRSIARRSRSPRARTRALKALLFAAGLVPLALVAWAAFAGNLGANPIREFQHRTGIWTLRFLALTLAVTPLRRLTGWNEAIKYRRMLGLFAFFYASVHLVNYMIFDWSLDLPEIAKDVAKHKYITVGMAGFLLLLPLAITSTKGWIRRLGGRRWQQLHRLIYAAAIAGVVHYLWAVKKDITLPLAYAALFAVLLGTRAWVARRASGP
ncbi:MAG TPA: protein-methionine-sulfoxide reductase heme-binding subunit MsrQ [Gemmatimonadaceae bacterium]|nr:protein-methionine-sulfoxide reductase heme-binding subunit MsrQ [Gemmatimonadaceae bacterium]